MDRRRTSLTWATPLLIVTALAAGVLMLGPFQGAERLFSLTDKEAHAAAFFTLTLLSFLALPRLRRNDLALCAIALGAAAEVAQACVGRDGNLPDLMADALGVLLAWAPAHAESLRQRLRSPAAGEGLRRLPQPWRQAARSSRPQ